MVCNSGRVPAAKHAVQIDVATTKNDNWISLDRPVPVTLTQSGIFEGGGIAVSPSRFNRTDELFVYEVGPSGLTVATYYYFSGKWEKVGATGVDQGATEVFKPGQGVILRKAAAGANATIFITNEPNY